MHFPTRRTFRRALALVLAAGAVALFLWAPLSSAFPMCNYSLTYYSDASKIYAVGFVNVAPESCGCYRSDVGQHTAYYTVRMNTSCWLPD
jgi:hypothetical protein